MSLNIPTDRGKRVVVAGGGFAGITALRRLARSGYQVVLIDRNNYHKFQPLLYQVAIAELDPGDITFPFRKLFRRKRNVWLRMAEVTAVDPWAKTIMTDRGPLPYDYLILATGSTTNFFGMEHIAEESLTMKEVQDSLAIRNRVLRNLEMSLTVSDQRLRESLQNIVIVGGGASGIELAGAFAEMKRYILPRDFPELDMSRINIYLIEGGDKLIGTMSEKTSNGALHDLRKMGVEVILGQAAKDYRGNSVILADGRAIPTHNMIWTSGVKVVVPDGLDTAQRNKSGRLYTDNFMRVTGYPDIYAVGDVSYSETEQFPHGYPQLAREAMEQASCVAKNLVRKARGRQEKSYRRRAYPIMAAIGRNKAYAEYGKFHIGGFVAWVLWAAVHLVSILGVRNKLSAFWGWFWNYVTFDNHTRVIIEPQAAYRDGKQESGTETGKA